MSHSETYPQPLTPKQLAAEYNWMITGGPAVDSWVIGHNVRANEYLSSLPGQPHFEKLVRDRVDQPETSLPIVRGGRSFQLRRSVGEQQSSLWMSSDEGDICLVSADELATPEDSITEFAPSPDGCMVAWASCTGGADWMVARIRDTATGLDRDDYIDGIKWPSFGWLGNSRLAYMSWGKPPAGEELTAINSDASVRVHTVGTSQDADQVVYRPADTAWVLPTVSGDGCTLFLQELDGTVPATILRQSVELGGEWVCVTAQGGPERVIDAHREATILVSYRESSLGQVVSVASSGERTIITEGANGAAIDDVHLIGDTLVILAHHISGTVISCINVRDRDERRVDFSGGAVVHGLSTDADTKRLFIDLEVVGGARQIETVDLIELFAQHDTLRVGSESPWTVTTEYARSADGTEIPMRVIRSSESAPSGDAKVFLSLYGGYSVPYLATGYSEWHAAWVDAGGVLAIAGIRGGSEYGEAWHQAATGRNKQRSVDDLLACVAWFTQEGWASERSVAINGMSNGGMLVSAALTQRPDMLGAAVPEVPVTDMLNFQRYTAAHGWIREYGDPSDADDYAALAEYSPLHTVRNHSAYPPVLVLTADRDDRVPPGPHAYPFVAELDLISPEHTLLRVALNAGHGTGRSLNEKITERTAVLAFCANALSLN